VIAKNSRLYFIDAMRAWAILMMLQGHFIEGLLDTSLINTNSISYSQWSYFRGITAPVFFTVSGFIFTYLLIKSPEKGLANPRLKKGIKRGLQILGLGYLLRANLLGLLLGEVYYSFFIVDVLHCIGLSLLVVTGLYLVVSKFSSWVLVSLFLLTTLLLFTFEPYLASLNYTIFPLALANYFTKAHGSIFTILPWLGYVTFGSFMAMLFSFYSKSRMLYTISITLSGCIGLGLILGSSAVFKFMGDVTGVQVFQSVAINNYLFMRLGDVLLVFALFMLLRNYISNKIFFRIGQNTLAIYIIHFVILYGSFTGLGLYGFFHKSLAPWSAIVGALIFTVACCFLALKYDTHKGVLHKHVKNIANAIKSKLIYGLHTGKSVLKIKAYRSLKLFRLNKN